MNVGSSNMEKAAPKNPFRCCNLKLRKAILMVAVILICQHAFILAFYMFVGLYTEEFVESISKCLCSSSCPNAANEDKPPPEILRHVDKIHVISFILWCKELVVIMQSCLLLFGARHEKYEFFRSWMIFTILNICVDLLVHPFFAVKFGSFILAWPLLFTIPVFLLVGWAVLKYMREIKFNEKMQASCIYDKGPRASKVYEKVVCVKNLNTRVEGQVGILAAAYDHEHV